MLTATAAQSQAQTEFDNYIEQQAQTIATRYITHPDVTKYPKQPTYGYKATVSNPKTNERSLADIVVINPSLLSIQRAVAAVLGNEWIVSFPESTGLPF